MKRHLIHRDRRSVQQLEHTEIAYAAILVRSLYRFSVVDDHTNLSKAAGSSNLTTTRIYPHSQTFDLQIPLTNQVLETVAKLGVRRSK